MEELLMHLIEIIAQGMPELSVVDEDYGQLEALLSEGPDTYPLTFPAVLIDAPDTSWSNIAHGNQKGECNVAVKLIIDCYADTHYGSTTTSKITERAEMKNKLHRLIQNLSVNNDATALNRTRSRYYTTAQGIKVYEQHYTCTVNDEIIPKHLLKKIGVKVNAGITPIVQQ